MSLILDDVQALGGVCDGEDVCVCQAEMIRRQDTGPQSSEKNPGTLDRRWCAANVHDRAGTGDTLPRRG